MHQDRPALTALSGARRVAAALLLGVALLLALTGARARAAALPPAPGSWTTTGSTIEQERENRTNTRLPDGRVLLAGGVDDLLGAKAATDIFDPATETWSAGGCLGDQRNAPAMVALADGRVLIFGGACDRHSLETSEIYDPATGRFTPTGREVAGHSQMPAVLLHDGRVLAAGNGSDSQIYDPAATDPATGLKGRWTAAGFLHLPVDGPSMTTLQDGRVLLAGGNSGGPFSVAHSEIYDPVTGLWTVTGSLNVTRVGALMALLPDGRVLIAGGFHEDVGFGDQRALDSAELYNPATGSWTLTGSMASLRQSPGGAFLPSTGKVLIAGGADSTRTPVMTSELYDPATGTWSPTAGAPAQEHFFGSVERLTDGRVMAVGGSFGSTASEIYDPATDSWSTTAPLAESVSGEGAVALPGGKLLIRGTDLCCPVDKHAAQIYDPAANTWTAIGPRATGRNGHTATLLPSGKVLIAGGIEHLGGGTTASAELYDPAGDFTSDTGSLGTGRSGQTATLLPNGKVLVAGGLGADGAPLGTAELYDPASGSFSPAGSLGARSGHTATLLPSGEVLVVGGKDAAGNPLDSVELYHPGSNDWSAAASVPDARSAHTATALADGRVLVVGGIGADGVAIDSAAIYGTDGSWTVAHALGTARVGHTATLLPGGDVLVTGGTGSDAVDLRSAELYHPQTDTWTPAESLSRQRTGHNATLLADGRVLVVGGAFDTSAEIYDPAAPVIGSFLPTGTLRFGGWDSQRLLHNGKVLSVGGGPTGQSAELFNPLSGRWSPAASLLQPHSGAVAVVLADGRMLVAGGGTAAAEIYDPQTNTWASTGSMTVARTSFEGALLGDGRVLVMGGVPAFPGGFDTSSSTELYDPATGTWTAGPPSAIARGSAATLTSLTGPGCAPNCGKALAAGGPDTLGLQLLELFDPATNAFTSPGLLSGRRDGPSATRLLDGRVLIAGGRLNGATAERYDPAAPDTTATGPMRRARLGAAVALAGDGTVLVAGGRVETEAAPQASAELYDPATNRWRYTGNLRTPRRGASATSLPRGPFSVCGENCGKVLVAGGDTEPFFRAVALKSAELFTPAPRVTSVDTAGGPVSGGTLVTIKGSGLAAAARVTFGDTQAASFIPDEDSPVTTLTVVAPAHVAGTVDVRITTAGGISDTSAADRFTYSEAAAAAPVAAAAPASTPASTPKAADKKAPTLGPLHLSRSRFHRAAGTRISFTLSERATVALAFARVLPCKTPRHGCSRLVKVSPAMRINGRKGANRITFRGRLSARRTLRAGRYKLTARATDAAGNRSGARTARFVLLR